MEYITHTRFKGVSLCGDVNIPALTPCECRNGIIICNGKTICAASSENGITHFCRNDDGRGMERGRLSKAIRRKLEKKDKDHQARWDKVWADPVCQPYKRTEYDDYWIWNEDFYNADIAVLEHIARLVGAEVR